MSNITKQTQPAGYYGLFNDSFPPILDGVTLTVENYARWLSEKGMKPCVVTPWNPVKGNYPYEVIRFFSLPIRSRKPYRYGYPKLDPYIWRRLKKTPFTLLHSHCPFSSGRLAVYVKKHQHVPLIGTFHSKYRTDLEHSFRYAPWCVPIIMKRILNFFNACDEVWIPQAQVEETVREYGYKGKLTVVENGNDFLIEDSAELERIRHEARKTINDEEDNINLLFVGQHIWEKGLDTVLATLVRLYGKIKFHMNFVGTGYAYNEIRESINNSGLSANVTLNGVIKNREELRRLYAASDIFIFPSYYDNAPLVIREAAAMGTPSILLKESTASEVISDGRNGFLVDKNPEEFASLIERLSRNKEELKRVGLNARNTLARSWEDVVEEVSDRYRHLINRMK